jgi:hypothetical protein
MIRIVEFEDGNNNIYYRLKKTTIFNIPIFGYLWSDGEIGACGQKFDTLDEAQKVKNSFEIKKRFID